jgi:hypothetical protein
MKPSPKSTREFIKSNRVGSTYQSPLTEEQIDPSGRMDLRSTKLKRCSIFDNGGVEGGIDELWTAATKCAIMSESLV